LIFLIQLEPHYLGPKLLTVTQQPVTNPWCAQHVVVETQPELEDAQDDQGFRELALAVPDSTVEANGLPVGAAPDFKLPTTLTLVTLQPYSKGATGKGTNFTYNGRLAL
jgi:hypothetical protein